MDPTKGSEEVFETIEEGDDDQDVHDHAHDDEEHSHSEEEEEEEEAESAEEEADEEVREVCARLDPNVLRAFGFRVFLRCVGGDSFSAWNRQPLTRDSRFRSTGGR